MQGIRWFVCLLGFFLGLSWVNICVADEKICQDALEEAVVFVPKVRRPTLPSRLYLTKGKRFKLGRGNFGRVVKVADRRHPDLAYVEKTYWEPGFLGPARAFLQALKLAQNFYGPFSFGLIEVLGQKKQNTLMMNYVEGRDLHSLLVDPKISENLKDELAVVYVAKLEALRDQLQNRLGIRGLHLRTGTSRLYRDRHPDEMPYLLGTNKYGEPTTEIKIDSQFVPGRVSAEDAAYLKRLRFMVSSSNVIVSPLRDDNGLVQMTVIDLD